MAVNTLRNPTGVGDVVTEGGVDFISWDGANWWLYVNNQDNPVAPAPDASTTSEVTVADVIIGNIPTGSGSTSGGVPFLTYTFRGQTWYRILGTPNTVTTTDPN